jgi:hypothetical protein
MQRGSPGCFAAFILFSDRGGLPHLPVIVKEKAISHIAGKSLRNLCMALMAQANQIVGI